MINKELINPRSIVVVGGSDDVSKPGGRLLANIISNGFEGELFVINKKSSLVQGIKPLISVEELPKGIDLAIIVIPSIECKETIKVLAENKSTKAFIIISAGFSESGVEGKKVEEEVVSIVKKNNGCLIGPNCIGLLNRNYAGVFTLPIPSLSTDGCDLISSSGATAVFLMEAGIPLGVKFCNVFSLGNCAMVGVEEVLEFMDRNFDPSKDPKTKLLYLEHISNPKKFLKHAKSLVKKGANIAAIKSGITAAGSRAAASHTGALASSDQVIRALFRKAGIIYCSSRSELLSIASLFHYRKKPGKKFAIISHAGGSAVMLTDALEHGGLSVPEIKGKDAEKLLTYLNPGSSVSNPIDFLATGTAEQLGIIIDYCENKFDDIDAMIVVFGSPGLINVRAVYDVLSVKLDICKKPIYPVLPSLINAQDEIKHFLNKGHINFPFEIALGNAIVAVDNQNTDYLKDCETHYYKEKKLGQILNNSSDGFLDNSSNTEILHLIGITTAKETYVSNKQELQIIQNKTRFPCVMKVVGPVHKTETGGVLLNLNSKSQIVKAYDKLMSIEGAKSVQIQPMLQGHELFIGIKREDPYGHLIFCGFGGIYIELIKDFSAELAPISENIAQSMVERLRGYPILQGFRGKKGIDIEKFVSYIQKISDLVCQYPQISELDINPLIATAEEITAVDVRIRIEK